MTEDTKYPSQLAERFQIRMPEGLRDEIRISADLNGRSMNAEIIHRLKNPYQDRGNDEPWVSIPWEVYHRLTVEAQLHGVSENERVIQILQKAQDENPDYAKLLDKVSDLIVEISDLVEDKDKLRERLEKDFILYYGKVIQINQFIELLLSDAKTKLDDNLRKVATDLKNLNQAEIDILQERYKGGLEWVMRRDNEAANEKSVKTSGEFSSDD